jgi:DNA-directed RNA polymerase subunit M/transcription elongation factor TFIIS
MSRFFCPENHGVLPVEMKYEDTFLGSDLYRCPSCGREREERHRMIGPSKITDRLPPTPLSASTAERDNSGGGNLGKVVVGGIVAIGLIGLLSGMSKK